MKAPKVCDQATSGRHTWRYVGSEWKGRRRMVMTKVCLHCGASVTNRYRPMKSANPY